MRACVWKMFANIYCIIYFYINFLITFLINVLIVHFLNYSTIESQIKLVILFLFLMSGLIKNL